MGKRSNTEDTTGVKKGPWLPEEDTKLVAYINKHGHGSWSALPELAGLNRCGKSCRLRWTNYLRPDIKRGMFSDHEERIIIHLHSLLGNKWSAIASHLPGRTDNEIKNFWNTRLRKKLLRMGIDPVTHKPRADHILLSNLPQYFSNGTPSSPSSSYFQISKFQFLRDIIMGFMTTNNNTFTSAQVMGGDGTPQLGSGAGCDGVPFVLSEVEEEGYGSFLGYGQAPMVDDGDNGGVYFSGMGSGEASLNCSLDSEIFDTWREFEEDRLYDQGCSWGEIIN